MFSVAVDRAGFPLILALFSTRLFNLQATAILLTMLLDIRHGLTGEIVMQIEVKSDLSGWEVMNQVLSTKDL